MRNVYMTNEQYKMFRDIIEKENKYYPYLDDGEECYLWFNEDGNMKVFDFEFGIYQGSISGEKYHPVGIFKDEDGEWKHVAISHNPYVIEKDYKLSDERWEKMRQFLILNNKYFSAISRDFCFSEPGERDYIPLYNYELDKLRDNWILSKECTTLPYELLIEKEKYKNLHIIRVKTDKGNVIVTISKKPRVIGSYVNYGITKQEIKRIKNFIYVNSDILDELLNGGIGFRNGFLLMMTRVDEKGKYVGYGNDGEYEVCNEEYGWDDDIFRVRNKDGYYNFMVKDIYEPIDYVKEFIISDTWFDEVKPFRYHGNEYYGIAKLNGCWVKVFVDGTLEYIGVED